VIDITQSLMYGSSTKLIQPAADEEGEHGKKEANSGTLLPGGEYRCRREKNPAVVEFDQPLSMYLIVFFYARA
jgi:hypothetical protein